MNTTVREQVMLGNRHFSKRPGHAARSTAPFHGQDFTRSLPREGSNEVVRVRRGAFVWR